jgi:hypothetical protein
MKILAATPVQYRGAIYIAELTSDELQAVTALRSYDKIPATDRDGKEVLRDREKLESGDVISPSIAKEAVESISAFRDANHEIGKNCTALRAAMTKLQNAIPYRKESA